MKKRYMITINSFNSTDVGNKNRNFKTLQKNQRSSLGL